MFEKNHENPFGIHIPSVQCGTNAKVFAQAGVRPLSEQLLEKQLQLIGKVALSPAGSPLRRDTFFDGTLTPQIGRYVRRVGRPRQDWTTCLLQEARRLVGNAKMTESLANDSEDALQTWNQEIHNVMMKP